MLRGSFPAVSSPPPPLHPLPCTASRVRDERLRGENGIDWFCFRAEGFLFPQGLLFLVGTARGRIWGSERISSLWGCAMGATVADLRFYSEGVPASLRSCSKLWRSWADFFFLSNLLIPRARIIEDYVQLATCFELALISGSFSPERGGVEEQ